MPKACTNDPSTCRSPLVHLVSVSIYAVVHGYRRTLEQLKAEMLPLGPHGFLLEVGRGRILRKYQRRTNNVSQFISTRFEAFCEKWKIRLTKSTPRYPQCNGQAETINKTVPRRVKKRLEAKKGRWAEELRGVLWYMPSSTRSNKNPQLLYSEDPASLERAIRKDLRSTSIDINNFPSTNTCLPQSTETPSRRPTLLYRRPTPLIQHRAILLILHRSILNRETW
ncbi:hypothetical protein Bca4012_026508 [Brassica carinata]